MKNFEVIILAGGKGTRMKTNIPKLLNKIGNEPILEKTIKKALSLKPKKINVVINKYYSRFIKKYKNINFIFQKNSLGTGHALKVFFKKNKNIKSNLIVMMGDAPSIKIHSIKKVINCLKKSSFVILGAKIKKNFSQGVIIIKKNEVQKIKEYKFLKPHEKKNGICNTGVMGIKNTYIKLVNEIKKNKIKKEYLITDLVSIAKKSNIDVKLILTKQNKFSFGINNIQELAAHN